MKASGRLVDAGLTLARLRDLREMQAFRPKQFEAFVALAQGRPVKARPKDLRQLKDLRYVGADGQVNQEWVDLLGASLEVRDNGYVLVQPFILTSERDRLIAEGAEERWRRSIDEASRGAQDKINDERKRRDSRGPSPG